MKRQLFPSEHYKMLQMMRERSAYKDMAWQMQAALRAIAGGDGDAQLIAQQTLDQLQKEYGNGPEQTGAHDDGCTSSHP